MHSRDGISAERLGMLLRERRKECGLTAYEVAAAVGLHRTRVEQVERGIATHLPSPRQLEAWAQVLDVSQAALLEAAGYAVGGEQHGGAKT